MSNISPPSPAGVAARSFWFRYGFSLLALATALGLQVALAPMLHGRASYLLVLVAVAFASWYSGALPGALTAVLGAAAAGYLALHPVSAATSPAWDQPSEIAVYLIAASAIIIFAAGSRAQMRRVNASQKRLRYEFDRQWKHIQHLKARVGMAQERKMQLEEQMHKLKAALREQAARLQIAQQSGGICVFEWRHESGEFAAFSDLELLNPEGWRKFPDFMARVHPEDRRRFESDLAHALSRQTPFECHLRVLRADASTGWLAFKARSTYSEDGAPLQTLGILQDITAAKLTEQALLRSERLAAAGRLAPALGHEINASLAEAASLLFVIRQDSALSPASHQCAEMAEHELDRVARMTRQFLGFYKENVLPEKVDLRALLDEVVEVCSREMPTGILIEKGYSEDAEAEVVEGEVRQVLSNVVMNAVEALGAEGTLSLSILPAGHVSNGNGEGLFITVEDSGPGIPDSSLALIYEPFFAIQRQEVGGLGLWMARQLMERNGGSIAIASRTATESHGTSVRLFFPTQHQRASAAQHAA